MNLKETILKHNETQERKDGFYTIEYDNNGSHAALIKEMKALNNDTSFPFTVQLTANNSIYYSHYGAKAEESADFSDLIQYLDILKRKLLELDSANKIGHIAKVRDEEGTQTFYIDGLNVGEDMTINVYKQR